MKSLLQKTMFRSLGFITCVVTLVAMNAHAQSTSIFTDSSLTAKTVSVYGDATVVAGQSKFGGAVGAFDGAGDYLVVSPSPLNASPKVFTIEAWIYITSVPANGWPIVSQSATGAGGEQQLFVSGSNGGAANVNKLRFSRGAGAGNAIDLIGATSLPLNQWVHVALNTDGVTAKLFVNGNLDNSVALTSGWIDTAQNFYVATTLNTSAPQSQSFANGKVSDLRITKNSARYSNVFIPYSAQALLQESVDNYWPETSLILKGEGQNNSTNIVDGSIFSNSVSVVGDAQINTGQKKYGSSSLLFDGSGDALILPFNDNYKFGTTDFTVEFWINLIDKDSANGNAVVNVGTSNGYWQLIVRQNTIRVNSYTGSYSDYIASTTLENNAWHHVAWTRKNGVNNIYYDGNLLSATGSVPANLDFSSSSLYVGANYNLDTTSLNGYIDDLRITKGIARYTANFTPTEIPSVPVKTGDARWNNVSMLLNANGNNASITISDASPSPKIISPVGDIKISTAQSKFGGASASFDGSGDYLSLQPTSNFQFGMGDFTVEAWVNHAAPTGGGYLNDKWIFGSFTLNPHMIFFLANDTLAPALWDGSSEIRSSIYVQPNTWTHVAFVRKANVLKIFVNGVEGYSGSHAINFNSLATTTIGASASGNDYNRYFNGYIDDLRITKGIARYSGNFTPPTTQLEPARFVKDPYTNRVSLLLLSGATAVDAIPPSLTTTSKQTNTNSALDSITLNFNKAIEATSITGPQFTLTNATQKIAPVSSIAKLSATQYKFNFVPALLAGSYSLKVLPEILGENGLGLDQNANGIGGEAQDIYSESITVNTAQPNSISPTVNPLGNGNGTSLSLSWLYTPVVNGADIVSFKVYSSLNPYTNIAQATLVSTVAATANAATLDSLLANTTYYISVVAVDSKGSFTSQVTPVAVKPLASVEQVTTYTYNSLGQILTENGPRTDVNDVTTYTYDALGTRLTTTNALNQVIHYNTYDGAGRLLSVTDANGITTEFTYHDRGWLLSSRILHPTTSTLDTLTTYSYDAVGQMISMTLPNGYVLGYEYDDARRLKAIKNPAGERIEYTLDAAGNRTQEVIKNTSSTIVYSAAQAFDELSRVMSITGNHSQNEKHQYDANDNDVAVTDGRNNKTQQTYDALNRVAKIIDPNLKETQFTYDSQNRIKTVTDARNNTTTYNYDGFGNLLSQVSPDTGTTTFTYDPAGNRTSSKDARNVVMNYSYDALNRLTSVSYPASTTENVTYTYDSTANGSYGIGRLASVTNSTATVSYTYNHLGLITQKRSVLGSITLTTTYGYDVAGNLTSITYPSGRIVTYVRDTAGRVQSITTKETAAATAQNLLTGISYMPFGPASSYLFGNGLSHIMSFDSDYRVSGIQVGGVLSRNYNYDNADNISGITDAVSATKTQTFTYDNLDRLTSANGIYGYQAFSYDAVGNRTGFLGDNGTGILSDTYNYETTSNRLSSINKTTAGVASGTRSFLYDAAGNRTQGTADDNKIQNYTYNNANRLSTAKVTNTLVGTYSYNALGQRIKKVATTTELYQYDESGQLIAVTDATGKSIREYIYNGNQLISFVNVGSTAASPVVLTGATATLQSAALSTAQTGYSDPAGFIQFTGEGQTSWSVTAPAGGTNSITLRYSMVGTNRPVTIWLDGVQKTAINFSATANLNSWSTTTTSLGLTAGTHTLTIKSNGNSAPNLDKVTLSPPTAVATTTYYVHNDHQGTPQVVTNQAKAVVWMADYQPFGKLNPGQANSIELYSRFPGQYADSETGTYYNYFRDYDPSIGRYIESDPIGLAGGINTYAYVEGNPLKGIDPLGLTGRGFPNANTVGDNKNRASCECDPNNNSGGGLSGQAGLQGAIHVAVVGFSVSGGGSAGAGTSGAGGCMLVQMCMRVGPGAYLGAGGAFGASAYSGKLSQSGGLSIGVGADAGTGASVGGQVTFGVDTDAGGINSVGAATGHGGFGGGISAGIDVCWTEMKCSEKCQK